MDKERSKAKTVIHAEYEILKAVIDRVPLDEVHHFMVREIVNLKPDISSKDIADILEITPRAVNKHRI